MNSKKCIIIALFCITQCAVALDFDGAIILQSIEECLEPVTDCLKSLIQKDVFVGTFENKTDKKLSICVTIGCFHHVTGKKYLLNGQLKQIIEPNQIYEAFCSVNRVFDTLLDKKLYPELVTFAIQKDNEHNGTYIVFDKNKIPKNKHIVFTQEIITQGENNDQLTL